MMSHDTKGPSNTQMHPAPTSTGPQSGEMRQTMPPEPAELLQPTLPEGILPLYLAKVHPEAAQAALEAGSRVVDAAPEHPRDIANVNLPYDEQRPPADAPVKHPVAKEHPPKDK